MGLAEHGGRRRVPGLRREELAQLAGVSAGYYTRLEQGNSPNASDAVLDAIARVLRLDAAEQAHLYALARPAPATARRRSRQERLRPSVRLMLDAVGDTRADHRPRRRRARLEPYGTRAARRSPGLRRA
ncbi:helix-turn-helix domain-containing protein [Nonomuraea antimicrobica]